MLHAPIWWYVWLGVVLLFGMISTLRWLSGGPLHMPEQQVPGRLAASKVDRNGELDLSDEEERAGCDPQVMAAALEEVVYASRYAMALASHDPSFAPDAPISPFDPGGPAHMDV